MKHHLFFALALGLTACMNSEKSTGPQQSTNPQPGQLQLGPMNGLGNGGLGKISVAASDSTTYAFNLDTAKSSIQEYFILQNTGDYDIKNITLTTNNPQFYFSPSTIPVLHPSKSSSILQVIVLNVIHGTRLNGVGSDSLLPPGNNTALAQITASTTDSHGDSVAISQSATLKTFAEIMDMDLYQGTTKVVQFGLSYIGDPTFYGENNEGIRAYGLKGAVQAVNTGNVDIKIHVWATAESVAPMDSLVLKPDSTASFTGGLFLQLDAQGAISRFGKFSPLDNGMIVIQL